MAEFSAAGHLFRDGRCECGRRWVDIRNTPDTWVGETGIHCNPEETLSHFQWGQIRARMDLEDKQFEEAMGWKKSA